MTGVAIRLARPEEIDALVAIDDDACTLDAEAGLVMAFDASHPFVVGERARWVAAIAGRLLEVAEAPDGALVGFAARGSSMASRTSISSRCGGRGCGAASARRLLRRAIAWAAADSSSRLWLTTWAHVPWNAPFYARHGFVAHPEAACGPELRAILRRQREVLPDPDRRIAMVHTGGGVTPRGSRARS